MEGKFCSNCNQKLEGNAYICKYCGSVNDGSEGGNPKESSGKGRGIVFPTVWAVLIVIIIVALVVLFK